MAKRESAVVGARKTFGGREYIKTAEGWKYLGKGGGAKAKEHAAKHTNAKEDTAGASKPADKDALGEHASKTPTETLTAVAHDESKPKEMREAAEEELRMRKDGETAVKDKHDPEEDKDGIIDVTDKEEVPIPKEDKKPEEKKEEPKKDEKKPTEEAKPKGEKKSSPESEGLPNEKSVKDAEVLGEKDGAAKLSEKEEGFSVKAPEALTSDDGGDADDDINHKFAAFGRFAAGVIKGRMKSLIAYGSGGVGKTYTVTQELQKAGKKIFDPEMHDPGDSEYDYVKMTGKMTAAAVYQAMYEHNGKILLFDDCDAVLQDDNAINLFKGALDTSGDGSIDWGSAKKLKDSTGTEIPGKFAFNGSAIFISNLNMGKDKNGKQENPQLQPIASRGYGINLTMDASKTMDRIRHIATGKDGKYDNLKFPGVPHYTHEDMDAVFKYMDKHKNEAADLNVRTVATLLAIKLDAEAANEKDWTKDARYVYLRKSEDPDIYNGGIFKQRQDALNKSMGVDTRSTEEKKIDWCTMRKSFYKDNVYSNTEV